MLRFACCMTFSSGISSSYSPKSVALWGWSGEEGRERRRKGKGREGERGEGEREGGKGSREGERERGKCEDSEEGGMGKRGNGECKDGQMVCSKPVDNVTDWLYHTDVAQIWKPGRTDQ